MTNQPLCRLASFELGLSSSDGSWGGAEEESLPQTPEHGYDVLVRVIRASQLTAQDWWNGKADPYVIVRTTVAGAAAEMHYKTSTRFRSLDPEWDEFFELSNVTEGSCLAVEVWDKDILTADDPMGRASWVFAPSQQRAGKRRPHSGRVPLQLQLRHPTQPQKLAGRIELEVHFHPSPLPGAPRMLGPVRFVQCFSPNAGFMMGRWNDDRTAAFCVWKLFLVQIKDVFDDVRHPWNRKYPKACSIYRNPVLLSAVRSQHSALFSTHLGRARCGVLCSPTDFFAALNNGYRAGQRRYFTYSLLPDSLRCSETGAAFFSDFMSKHSMHAGGAEEVVYAGEFCIVPDEEAVGGHRLVIDNNSGTFAPRAEHLPLIARLFEENFPGMAVEAIASDDPRLEEYHKQCPSRLSAAAAAAAAAEAAEAAEALGRASLGTQQEGEQEEGEQEEGEQEEGEQEEGEQAAAPP